MNFFKGWSDAPKDLRLGLIGVIWILAISGAIAISKSNKVEVDRDGFTISNTVSNQAIANQKELEKALLTIQTQRAAIEQHGQVADDFARKYPVAKGIAESAEHAADIVPDTAIDEIKETIGQSELLLNQVSTNFSEDN